MRRTISAEREGIWKFFSTLNQMGILFTFIVIGYLLMKFGGFPADSATIPLIFLLIMRMI